MGELFTTSGAKKCFDQTRIRCYVYWPRVDRVVKDGMIKAGIISWRPGALALHLVIGLLYY